VTLVSETGLNLRPDVEIRFVAGPAAYRPGPMLPNGGGESVFLGRTRLEVHKEHGALQALRYEAYESMALETLARLVEEIDKHMPLRFVRIEHSLGDVPVGDASVFIQVISAHRAEAMAACKFLIDRLKSDAPIWKGEVWSDGHITWPDGHVVGIAVAGRGVT